MDESIPASLLVLAGLLRLAGVSQSEPWSSYPPDPVFLEEELVTTKTRPVSVSEGDTTEATLQFDSFTSNLADGVVSHSHAASGTQAEGITEAGKDQLQTSLGTARPPERSAQSLDAATAWPQSDAPFASKPLTSTSALTGEPESKAESTSLSKHSAEFLPREERTGHPTAWELMSVERSTPFPSKLSSSSVELLATLMLKSDSSESAKQPVTSGTSLSQATAPGNLHTLPFIGNQTEAEEELHGEIMQTFAKERLLEKLLTLIPKSSQHSQVKSQPGKPDIGSSDVLLTQTPQSPLGKVSFSMISRQTLSEEDVASLAGAKMTQHSSFASSPHGEMKEHTLTGHAETENPTLLAPSRSNARPLPFLSTPGTLSLKTSSLPAFSGDFGQSSLSKLVFSSQFPKVSKSAASTNTEQRFRERMNLTLHHGIDPQTQASHFKLSQTAAFFGGPLPVSQMKETTTIVVSVPADPKSQPSGILPPLHGKPRLRVPGMTPMANFISSRVRPTTLAMAAPSKVGSPSLVASAAAPAGAISQSLAKVQLPATPSSVYGEQPFPIPSLLIDPEPAAISSAPANQPTPDVPSGFKRPASPVPPHIEPDAISALTHTKSPSPGNSAPWHSGLNTSAVIDSAPSRLTPPVLSTLADGELQESVFGQPAPYHAEERLLGNSASTPARSTAAGTSSPPVEPDAPGVVARLSVPGTSALNHPLQKPSAVLPVHAKTPSLLAHICAKSQPAAMPIPAGGEEPAVSIPDMHVPSHVTSHVPGSSASFMDEPSLLITSVPTHAKPKINEAPTEIRLPISTPATPQRTGVSVSTLIQIQSLLFSAHAPTVQSLSGVSAELGALLHNETRTPEASSSPAVYIQSADVASRGQLKPEASSSSALVDTSPQSPGTSSSAHTGIQTPIISTSVHPGLQRYATTPIQSGMPHAPETESEGKHSSQSSPLTSPSGTYRAALPSVSPLPLRRSSPRLGIPTSLVSHRNASNLLPLVSGALVEESLPGLRTTPMLAVPDAQDRMSSSLGFIQHLNRSDVTATRSLESLAAEGYLRMPFSLHYLSVLARNAENLVCLQPIQDTTTSSPSGEPNASGRVASTQEMLLLSSSLGFSHLGASGLVQMSPSNVILVKPVLVFWPADKPDVPMLSRTEEEEGGGEGGGEHKASLPFTNKTVLGLVNLGDSQEEQPMETRPNWSTIRNPTRANTLSRNAHLPEKQVISGPVLNASPKYIAEASWVRSSGVTTVPSRSGLEELSTTTKSLKNQDQGEEFPTSALDLQGLEENNPALLPVGPSVEHQVSVTPPVVVSLQQRLKSLPATTSLYSLTEPSASRRQTSSLPTSRATERPLQGRRRVPVLHAETHPYGSLTPSTSIGKNIEGPLSASSAGNVELPLETGQQVTRSRPPSPGSSSTKLTGKLPVSMQAAVPSLVPDFLKLSSEQKHKESEALNHSYSEAALPFPMATEMPSYRGRAPSSQPSKRHPKSPLANEGLRSPPPLFTLFSADTRIPTTGGREDGENHQMLSRPPADVSLHLSGSSFFTKSAPKHNLATLMVSGTRASLANLEGHLDAEETNKSVRVPEIRNQTEATSFKPTMFGRDSGHLSTLPVAAELNSTAGSSSDSRQAADVQRGVNPFSPAPLLAPNSARRDLAVSPMGGKTSLWETAHGNLYGGTSQEGDTLLKQRGREQDGTPAHFRVIAGFRPQPVSLEGDPLERPRLLDDDQTPEAGSSLPRPGGTPSSAASIVLKASTFLMTTLFSGAAADGVGWISDQTSHLQTLPLDTSETFLNLHTQSWPTLESLSDASTATAEKDLLVEATGELTESGSYTMREQAAGMKDATEGAEDPVSPRLPQDPDRKAHHRRLLRSDDDVFLDGFAVVSDDACSSGNYSTAMSLRPGAISSAPSSPDSFLALIAVQDSSSSQPTLQIRSCCVTPTARPTGPDAACCLFPRPPLECGHIKFHQNGKSDTASFTIQLFQMLNHSVAYLHCELSICLSQQGGCEQGCLENRETLSRPSDSSSYRTRHNLISFGPVWKAQTEFPAGSAAGSAPTATPLFLLGSLTATALFVGVAIFIWLQRKCKTKMAAQGSDGP